MKVRSILLILAGILLVTWAAGRTAREILPALQPTPTPDQQVLEFYAPNSGPLNTAGAPSGEVESQPVAPTLAAPAVAAAHTPAPTQAAAALPAATAEPLPEATAAPAPADFDPVSQAEREEKSGPFLGDEAGSPAEPAAEPTPAEPAVPSRIVIPAIELDAPVTLAASQKVRIAGKDYFQWTSPDLYAAGWHTNSAYLNQPGNTVLNGHNNIFGKVFGRLKDLSSGDRIEMYAGDQLFAYRVVQVMILPERDVPVAQRLENARWISHSADVRLTLVTCWPDESNTHRVIVVAVPE